MLRQNNIVRNGESQPQDKVSANYVAACNLARLDYKVFPCDPATKRPLVKWRDASTTDLAKIERWWKKRPDAMPGLPTGEANGVSVVDLDVRPEKDGLAAYRDLGLDPEDAGVTVTTPSGGRHLYFDHREGIANRATKAGIDVRGDGGYVIAPGAVGKAGNYRVASEHGMSDAKLLGFGAFPAALMPEDRSQATDQPAPGGEDIATLREALAHVPNDGTHDEWTRILMALHHATAGSAHGSALAHGWSAGYPGYDPKEVAAKWRSFGKHKGDLVTVETLYAEARANGWQGIEDDDLDDLDGEEDDDLDAESLALLGEDPKPYTELGGLRFFTPDQLAARPPRDYTIKRLAAPGQVGCIFGEPGAGKSVVAPYIGYRVARGEDVFGLDVKAGPVLYVAGEDFDGMGDRIKALRDEHGAARRFYTGDASDLFSETVAGTGSAELTRLRRAVKKVKPRLVFIDTLAATMPGVEENDAQAMNRVVHIGRELAREGTTVIFIHHGTKADGTTPRGHSVFNGALDFSIQVEAADQAGIVRGKVRKNRNGPPDLDIAFRIGMRVVGQYVDGQEIEAPICQPCPTGTAETGPRLSRAQTAALGLIHEMMPEDGGGVDEEAWKKAARDSRAVTSAEAPDSRRRAVAQALTALVQARAVTISDGRIHLPESDWGNLLDEMEGESDAED